MLFNSFIFLLFLALVLPLFYLLKNNRYKQVFLLFASYIFYGYWDWRFCFLLMLSTVVDYFVGKEIHKCQIHKKRKALLLISLFVNLGILAIFKYFNFFIESFEQIISLFGSKLDFIHLKIILPVGISFYTFQTLSYTIDIYKKKLSPTNDFISFALFVSFFPQLVAGPIERAKNLLPQLYSKLQPTKEQLQQGTVLIVVGLFRKVVIGDTSGRFVDHIFAQPELYFSVELLFGLILFSIQIYADFSGYSHIARGTAKLLGIELMKNFEQPYFSKNITEFWRRWHISLSTWLRDYLYIPLGGNRKGLPRTYINLMVTMLLGGLWHGASWNFVIWGGLHGIYLIVDKLLKQYNVSLINTIIKQTTFYKLVCRLFTYLLILFTWLFFRSQSWETTQTIFSQIKQFQFSSYTYEMFRILGGFVILILIFDYFEYRTKNHCFLLQIKNKGIVAGILSALLLTTLAFMFYKEPLPFIYFQF